MKIIKVSNYMGDHRPSRGAPLHDMTQIYPDDIYSQNAIKYYGDRRPEDALAMRIIHICKDKPNKMVKIYRSVPSSIENEEINFGDWVTTVKSYAVDHGNRWLDGDFKILEKLVPASSLFSSGDSIFEFGYFS